MSRESFTVDSGERDVADILNNEAVNSEVNVLSREIRIIEKAHALDEFDELDGKDISNDCSKTDDDIDDTDDSGGIRNEHMPMDVRRYRLELRSIKESSRESSLNNIKELNSTDNDVNPAGSEHALNSTLADSNDVYAIVSTSAHGTLGDANTYSNTEDADGVAMSHDEHDTDTCSKDEFEQSKDYDKNSDIDGDIRSTDDDDDDDKPFKRGPDRTAVKSTKSRRSIVAFILPDEENAYIKRKYRPNEDGYDTERLESVSIYGEDCDESESDHFTASSLYSSEAKLSPNLQRINKTVSGSHTSLRSALKTSPVQRRSSQASVGFHVVEDENNTRERKISQPGNIDKQINVSRKRPGYFVRSFSAPNGEIDHTPDDENGPGIHQFRTRHPDFHLDPINKRQNDNFKSRAALTDDFDVVSIGSAFTSVSRYSRKSTQSRLSKGIHWIFRKPKKPLKSVDDYVEDKPEDHIVLSCLTMIFLSPPFGIVALIMSVLSHRAYDNGDVELAKKRGHIALGVAITGVLITFIAVLVVLSLTSMPQK